MNKYVVIQREGNHLGLMSYVITNLGAINKFDNKGYIPVIDMMNVKNQYISDKQIGKVNTWEYFFEQPAGISMEDIKEKEYIIFDKVVRNRPNDSIKFFLNKKINYKWRNIAKKYLKLKPEIEELINTHYSNYFKKGDKVLGVLARGTDYVALKPFRHPVQPTVDQMIAKVDEVFNKYKYDKIFLATEDSNIYDVFRKKYGNKLITHVQKRYSINKKMFLSEIEDKDVYKKGLNYLISIVLLSKCNAFVGCVTSGTVAVQLFNPHYEYEYYFNLGRYGMPKFMKYPVKQK